MIEGVRVRPLQRNADARGSLTELLRSDWPEFTQFGQAILTVNLPGVIRGWHAHRRQTDVIIVVAGRVVLPLYDSRENSATFGKVDEHLVEGGVAFALFVPPGVYHGYKTLGVTPALIVNFPDQLYDPAAPDEDRVPHDAEHIPYDWDLRV